MEKDTSAPSVDSDCADQAPHVTTVPPKDELRKAEGSNSQPKVVTVGHDTGASATKLNATSTDRTETRSSFLRHAKGVLTWAPPNCRYDAKNPPKFGLALNLLFALVSFTKPL